MHLRTLGCAWLVLMVFVDCPWTSTYCLLWHCFRFQCPA
uniref:Uncharacterized protein n=1 Tax=Arundo donax TaxID=35708 RepID=A0A0A9AN37_ARUDO